MYMKLKDGKSKVVTLSYDDGVCQDVRLIEIMSKYGLKGTFNINSGRYAPEDKVRQAFKGRLKLSEAKKLYISSGNEVAVHAYTHPFLESLKPVEVIREVVDDRRDIEKNFGVIARGMAYPYGTYSDEVVDILEKCGICYSRTVKATRNFKFPENWLTLHPTCHHNDPQLMELAKDFINTPIGYAKVNKMFYLWGHSYEFDDDNNWNVIEQFAEYVGGRDDVWYATNIEIYDYVKAYERLCVGADSDMVYNPSAIDVWFSHKNKTYCVKAGQTVSLEEK